MCFQILTPISWMSVQLIHETQMMKNDYFCFCFFCRIKSICLLLAGSGQFNEVLTCTNDRQGTAALLLQGYCLLISVWGHQHPVVRTWNYHRRNTGHFEADSEEFLNTGKNGINIPLGFYTFLPYEADNPWWKAARSIWDRRCLQYLTEEIKNIIWSPEVFSSDSSIPASLPSFYICGVTMATVKTFYKIWGILRKRNSWMG